MPETNPNLYTLTDVSKKTSISMPTLQRYKKMYQARIPSEGQGRSQRYPESALEVFRELKKENVGKRGRPRKSASGGTSPARPAPQTARRGPAAAKRGAAASPDAGLLTLTEIAKLTKISYPTLLRYVKTHLNKLPHEGKGRTRRYHAAAVEVFKQLRSESGRGRKPAAQTGAKRRGRPPGSGTKTAAAAAPRRGPGRPRATVSDADVATRLRDMERSQKRLEKDVEKLRKQLSKNFKFSLGI